MVSTPKTKMLTRSLVVVTLLASVSGYVIHSFAQNGPSRSVGQLSFDNLKVPRTEIHPGGPPKDGIPAISRPRIVSADRATFLNDSSRVIGVALNGEARAWLNRCQRVERRTGLKNLSEFVHQFFPRYQ